MLEISNTGLVIERLDAILTRLSQSMRDIYGQDINLNADTQDGQFIGILSQGVADFNEVLAGVYAMSDPTTAVGRWLDIQLKYVGLERNRATFSYLNDVQFTVVNNTIIPEGYTLTDENGTEWTTTNTATSTGTSLVMQLRSVEVGAFHLASGKPLTPKTIVLGVQAVTTTSDSVLGRLQESDQSALARFLRSYSINNLDDREGTEAALLALTDVRDAKVYENYTNATDANGVEAHSINAVVLGGVDEDIALQILKKKAVGCGLQGSQTVTLFYEGMDRVIKFDRSTAVNISATITVVRRSSAVDVNQQKISDNLKSNQFLIAEDVIAGALYGIAYDPNYQVKSILLTSGLAVDALIIPIGLREHGVINAVTVVVE